MVSHAETNQLSTDSTQLPLLVASGLSCQRGKRRLFQDLTLRVSAGTGLLVQGANGSGKTSLLRMLAGLTSPTSGQVYWNGTPIRELGDEYRSQLLYCGHLNGLKDELSAEENLMTAAALSGRAVSTTMVRSALKDVGLGRCEQLTTRVLSQGQKRRVMLARLLLDPRPLWVLDEPLTALDADAVTWLSYVIDLHLQRGGVAVLTSHQDISLTGSVQTCWLGS